MKKLLSIVFMMSVLSIVAFSESKVRFSTAFSDNMVLQQKSDVKIWGYDGGADAGARLYLKCSWLEKSVEVTADNTGKWSATVLTPAGGYNTYKIELFSDGNLVAVLQNILIGEVWLCSGQSNMEMVMMNQPQWNLFVENSESEIAGANYPNIRFLNIQRKESFTQVEEVINNGWKVCNPDNVKWLSAVGYFFAKELHKKLDVPVGLIVSSYGGSPVQSWIPESVVKDNSLYSAENAERLAELKASENSEDQYVKAMSAWLEQSEGVGVKQSSGGGFEGDGVELVLPVNLEKSHVGNHMGQFSLSREIVAKGGESLHFNLGTMDDFGQVYFNGEKVWEELRNSKSYSQVVFDIPASKVKAGKNIIEARIVNVLWGGGLTGPDLFYQVGDGKDGSDNIGSDNIGSDNIGSDNIGSGKVGDDAGKISLKGSWIFRKGFNLSNVKPVPREGKPLFSMVSALYNGMLHPLRDFKIKGFLFYQGEANVGDTQRYPVMLTDMINSWRKAFNGDLPFYYVQIAPYKYSDGQYFKAAELRQAQALVEKTVPNTAMVATIDLGDSKNIHPAKKMEVGDRLANIALANTYKAVKDYRFPLPGSVKYDGDKIVLSILNAFNGLETRGECKEFEVSEDGKNYRVARVKVEGSKIILDWDKPFSPKYLRYCWADDCTGKIFNSKGLPLSSFKTEVKY